MKFLIVLFYWERPNIVKNALMSIRDLDYDNWELAFIDDGSIKKGEPIVKEILKDHLSKIKFYDTNQTYEDKILNQSHFGQYVNEAIKQSNADIAIFVCDDDALVPDYLNKLDIFFTNNPDKIWAYCHVIEYNPYTEVVGKHLLERIHSWHNRSTLPVSPACFLDCSQVVFRRYIFNDEIKWPYPLTRGLDATVFDLVWKKYGDVTFSGCIGQFKGVFSDQLGNRLDNSLPIDKEL